MKDADLLGLSPARRCARTQRRIPAAWASPAPAKTTSTARALWWLAVQLGDPATAPQPPHRRWLRRPTPGLGGEHVDQQRDSQQDRDGGHELDQPEPLLVGPAEADAAAGDDAQEPDHHDAMDGWEVTAQPLP